MTDTAANLPRIIVLSGGAGGVKLADGLYQVLPSYALGVIGNTGDDFCHLRLPISPDIDTIIYTLANMIDPERGWGRADETWQFMAAASDWGLPEWFQLGDKDLATHIFRRAQLDSGRSLSDVTRDMADMADVEAHIWPMSNAPASTIIKTDTGPLPFQDYFVKHRCEPAVLDVDYAGASCAPVNPDIIAAMQSPGLEAIIIGPSNPFLSIKPILQTGEMRNLITKAGVPVIAVSPLVGGRSVKGPTTKIIAELGIRSSMGEIIKRYDGLVTAAVIDETEDVSEFECATLVTDLLMPDAGAKRRLAEQVLEFAQSLQMLDRSKGEIMS